MPRVRQLNGSDAHDQWGLWGWGNKARLKFSVCVSLLLTLIVGREFLPRTNRQSILWISFGKGSFQKGPFSRDSRESGDSRDSRELLWLWQTKENPTVLIILCFYSETLEIPPMKRPLLKWLLVSGPEWKHFRVKSFTECHECLCLAFHPVCWTKMDAKARRSRSQSRGACGSHIENQRQASRGCVAPPPWGGRVGHQFAVRSSNCSMHELLTSIQDESTTKDMWHILPQSWASKAPLGHKMWQFKCRNCSLQCQCHNVYSNSVIVGWSQQGFKRGLL